MPPITISTDIKIRIIPVKRSMAIKPRFPNKLLMGKEAIKIMELMIEATITAPNVINLLDCCAAVIITIDKAAGPATKGIANGTTKG